VISDGIRPIPSPLFLRFVQACLHQTIQQHNTANDLIDSNYRFSFFVSDRSLVRMLWDTAGEEWFLAIPPSFLRIANGTMLVYDVTPLDSFEDSTLYLDLFLSTFGNWTQSRHVPFRSLVSAKTGDGVQHAFQKTADLCVKAF
jgi:hypothetical protein